MAERGHVEGTPPAAVRLRPLHPRQSRTEAPKSTPTTPTIEIEPAATVVLPPEPVPIAPQTQPDASPLPSAPDTPPTDLTGTEEESGETEDAGATSEVPSASAPTSFDQASNPEAQKPKTIREQLAEIAKLPNKERLGAITSTADSSISSQLIQRSTDRLSHLNEQTLNEANAYEASLREGVEEDSPEAAEFTIAQSDNLESRVLVLENIAYLPEDTNLTAEQQEDAQAAQDALKMLDDGGLKIFYIDSQGEKHDCTRQQWQTYLDSLPNDAARERATSSENRGVWQFVIPEAEKEPRTLAQALNETIKETQAKVDALKGLPKTKENIDKFNLMECQLGTLLVAQTADGVLGPALQLDTLTTILPKEDIDSIQQMEEAAGHKIPTWDDILGQFSSELQKEIGEKGIDSLAKLAENAEILHNEETRKLFFKSEKSFKEAKEHIAKYGEQMRNYYIKKGLETGFLFLVMALLVEGVATYKVAAPPTGR